MTIRKKEDYTPEQWQKILHERAVKRRQIARQRAKNPEQSKINSYKYSALTYLRHYADDQAFIILLEAYINEGEKQKNIINELKNWIKEKKLKKELTYYHGSSII